MEEKRSNVFFLRLTILSASLPGQSLYCATNFNVSCFCFGGQLWLQTIGLLGMKALQCSELKLFIYLPTKDMLHPCRKFPYFSVYRYRKNNIIRKITYVKTNN